MSGELAIAVLDDYQGLSLARTLIAALLVDCVAENLFRLEMQVLSENRAAIGLLKELGAERTPALDTVAHYTLDVRPTLIRMTTPPQPQGVLDVMASIGALSR